MGDEGLNVGYLGGRCSFKMEEVMGWEWTGDGRWVWEMWKGNGGVDSIMSHTWLLPLNHHYNITISFDSRILSDHDTTIAILIDNSHYHIPTLDILD